MEKKFRKPVNKLLIPDMLDAEGDIVPIIADGEDTDLDDVDVPDTIPILSLRNTVLFPGVVLDGFIDDRHRPGTDDANDLERPDPLLLRAWVFFAEHGAY